MEEQMAQQEDGWPLGLQPLNVRVGLIRSVNLSSSLSFSTLITDSSRPSSVASSDFNTESTGSFFNERGITLGNLIGITSILNLSSRSLRRSRRPQDNTRCKKSHNSKTWFSLCTKPCQDSERAVSAPSLGHLLGVERRASNVRRNRVSSEGDGSLVFVGSVERGNTLERSEGGKRSDGDMGNDSGFGLDLLFSCIGGQCNNRTI